MRVKLKVLDKRYEDGTWELPRYARKGDAAIDLRAAISEVDRIYPGERRLIKTGLAIHIDDPNYAALVLPRSGLGSMGLVLGNCVGLIDSGYQGEICIMLWNRLPVGCFQQSFDVSPGDRIAQLLVIPIARVTWDVVEDFEESPRKDAGFGSTGYKVHGILGG